MIIAAIVLVIFSLIAPHVERGTLAASALCAAGLIACVLAVGFF